MCVRVWRWVDAVPSSSSAPTPPPSSDRREAACGCVCACVRGCVWHVGVESGGGVGWCRCGEGGSRRLDGEPSLACRFFVRCRRRRAVGGGEGGVRTGKWPQRASPGGVGRRGARERKSAKGRGGGEESEEGWCSVCLGGERASEWCACPFAWTPQFLVLWGCAWWGCVGSLLGNFGEGKTSGPLRPRCDRSRTD